MAPAAAAVHTAGLVAGEAAMSHRASPDRPGVRAEVRAAKQQAAAQDPAWLKIYWPVWLAVVAVSFAVVEAIALVNRGDGGTLSEWTRRALGIDPPAPRRRWAAAGFLLALLAFAGWFGPHIVWQVW